MNIVSMLKKLPIDVGQGEKKHNSFGKRIAFSFIPSVSGGEKKTALDIGCRDGFWSLRLEEKGYNVSSLDIEPHYAKALKHDVEKGLPYQDKFFDIVWCTEVIEHIREPNFLLKEVERIIKPKSIVVFTTPNSNWWFYWITGLWGWTARKLQNPDHKQFFSETSIRKLAPEYQIFGYFPYMFFFVRITKLIGFLSPTFILVKRF